MVKTIGRPFGWLILGFCWALVIAHAIAVRVIVPGYYREDILSALLIILPAAGVVGIPLGSILEQLNMETGKPRLGRSWIILAIVALALLVLEVPAFNCARE
jgi:hypothetical protein